MLKKLISEFEKIDQLPIEVDDVAAALIRLGAQDSIIISDEDTDPEELCGAFYQYTTSPGVYVAPDFVTLIVYSRNVSVPAQRLICCKEIMHICDPPHLRTDTKQELSDLLEKVLGPLTTEDFGHADLTAAVDKFAIYQALGIMFPMAAREKALEKIASGEKTKEEIAEWACLPQKLIDLALDDEWPSMYETICSI